MYTLHITYYSDSREDYIDTRTSVDAHRAAEAISLLYDVNEVVISASPNGGETFKYVSGKQHALAGIDASQKRRRYIWSTSNEYHDPWDV